MGGVRERPRAIPVDGVGGVRESPMVDGVGGVRESPTVAVVA